MTHIISAETAAWFSRYNTYGSKEQFDAALSREKEVVYKKIDKAIQKAYRKGKFHTILRTRPLSDHNLCVELRKQVTEEIEKKGYSVLSSVNKRFFPRRGSSVAIAIDWSDKKHIDLKQCRM